MSNLAHTWVQKCGMSLEQARASWNGACVEFVGDLIDAVGTGRLAFYDDPPKCFSWKYHAVAEIDGMVHDLWRDGPAIALDEYSEEMGCEPEYPAEN